MARAYSSRSIAGFFSSGNLSSRECRAAVMRSVKYRFPLRSDAGAGERAVGSLFVDAAFQRGEDGNAHGDQPAAQAPEGAVVLLLGLPDFGGEFQHGGFVEARGCGQGGRLRLASSASMRLKASM